MKMTIQKTALVLMLMIAAAGSAIAQNAKTFYVCSGTSFTMVPDDTTHDNYEWDEIGGGANPIATTTNASVTAPTLAGTTYSLVQYTLKVQDSVGCWSEEDTFNVYVLPPVQVAVSGNAGPYCANSSTSVTLTATVGGLTLPAGVAVDQFAWTAGGTPTGTNSDQLTFSSGTVAGSTTYEVTVTYSLPVLNGGSKLTTCSGVDNTSVVINAAPTTPGISIQ